MATIPKNIAIQLCSEVLEENRARWYSTRAMQCWGCLAFSENALDRMCIVRDEGCSLVNERYLHLQASRKHSIA